MNSKIFTLFWRTGDSEIVKGEDIAQACTLGGYSSGAIRALDFYSEGDKRESYTWNKQNKEWDLND